jgi:hypothetical protein
MKIAICNDIRQFHRDQLRERSWSRKFAGSGWITSLYERQAEFDVEVASGDVALERVRNGSWRACDVHVVQELSARHGTQLCKLGAIPAILLILESPLVAYRQLDRIRRLAQPFMHCVGPTALIGHLGRQQSAEWFQLRFPSVWRKQLRAGPSWSTREHAVLVAANKYWRERAWSRVSSIQDVLRVIRHGIRRRCSPTFRSFRHLQLHDARFELLAEVAQNGGIDVYGHGWDRLVHLPLRWQRKLEPFKDRFGGPCHDKIEVTQRYRFALAFENIGYPGYFTEKIIDAMAAGAVPVYFGAPDVADHIPPGCFLDARQLGSASGVAQRMISMSESEAEAIREAGKTFLNSMQGDRHTYEGFAESIISIVRDTRGAK